MTEISLLPYMPSSRKVLSSKVQTALPRLHNIHSSWMADLLNNGFLEKCSMLRSCNSFVSRLVHWLGKEELACSTCLKHPPWEEMEVRELPQIQHTALLGLFWHSHGCLPGVYGWYRGEPNGSGCCRNNPFLEVVALPASKTENVLCGIGRAEHWDSVGHFVEHRCISHTRLSCCLLTEHVGMQLVAVVLSSSCRLLCL